MMFRFSRGICVNSYFCPFLLLLQYEDCEPIWNHARLFSILRASTPCHYPYLSLGGLTVLGASVSWVRWRRDKWIFLNCSKWLETSDSSLSQFFFMNWHKTFHHQTLSQSSKNIWHYSCLFLPLNILNVDNQFSSIFILSISTRSAVVKVSRLCVWLTQLLLKITVLNLQSSQYLLCR